MYAQKHIFYSNSHNKDDRKLIFGTNIPCIIPDSSTLKNCVNKFNFLCFLLFCTFLMYFFVFSTFCFLLFFEQNLSQTFFQA